MIQYLLNFEVLKQKTNISVSSLQHQFVFMDIEIAGEEAGRLLFEVGKLSAQLSSADVRN